MKSEYEKLVAEFQAKVAELQKNCRHEELTMPRVWNDGDFPTQAPRYCKRCNKMVVFGIEEPRRREG